MQIRLVIELVEDGVVGGKRAERVVDLPAVPRIGESVWVGKHFALRVKGVSWLWASEPDRPHVFFDAFENSVGIEMADTLTVKLQPYMVKDLEESGWEIDFS